MKIKKEHTIGFFDVDHNCRLTVQAGARLFQEMATMHSASVGAGYERLSKMGRAWFLHCLQIEFVSYPVWKDRICVVTWSRGFKGFKGFREYEIRSADGELMVMGSSVWLFYDVNRHRIAKVPKEISACYEFDEDKNFADDPDKWEDCGQICIDRHISISLRYSDFDMNGHVNNTVYPGFLEHLYHDALGPDALPVKRVRLRFLRQIDPGRHYIEAGWQKKADRYECLIRDNETVFAQGELVPFT